MGCAAVVLCYRNPTPAKAKKASKGNTSSRHGAKAGAAGAVAGTVQEADATVAAGAMLKATAAGAAAAAGNVGVVVDAACTDGAGAGGAEGPGEAATGIRKSRAARPKRQAAGGTAAADAPLLGPPGGVSTATVAKRRRSGK